MWKRIIIILFILAALSFLIFGLLYGWFRRRKSIPADVAETLANVSPRSEIPVSQLTYDSFSQLWLDHVSLTRKFILEFFEDDPNVNDTEKALLRNQVDIGTELDKYYPNASAVIVPILTEHIIQAKDILTDLKFKRFSRLFSDINKWYDNAALFSDAMKEINPKWNLHSHMDEHLRITEREALYKWLGANQISADIYEKRIIPNAQEFAEEIVNGL